MRRRRRRVMDYGAINSASLGKRRRPGSGWNSAAPPPMPRARRVSPLRDDEDDDAFLDESERERRDAVREMGRWSEDQLRDFLEIKGESHEDLRTHAELLRRAVDAETGATGARHDNDDAPAPTGDAANDDDDYDDLFEAFMAGIADEVKAAPAPRPAHTAANKPTRATLDDDDDDDPMMSFVRARASGKTTAAATRTANAAAAVSGLEISLANSSAAGVDDEDVYAAAAAADAAATGGTQLCARPGRPGASGARAQSRPLANRVRRLQPRLLRRGSRDILDGTRRRGGHEAPVGPARPRGGDPPNSGWKVRAVRRVERRDFENLETYGVRLADAHPVAGDSRAAPGP